MHNVPSKIGKDHLWWGEYISFCAQLAFSLPVIPKEYLCWVPHAWTNCHMQIATCFLFTGVLQELAAEAKKSFSQISHSNLINQTII